MPTHELDHSTGCPSCGRKSDAVTNVTGFVAPRPGDVSVCWYCGALLELLSGDSWAIARPEHPAQTDPTVLQFRAELIGRNS